MTGLFLENIMNCRYLKSLLLKLFRTRQPNVNKYVNRIKELESRINDDELMIKLNLLKISILKDDIESDRNKIESIKDRIEDKNYAYYLKTGVMLDDRH